MLKDLLNFVRPPEDADWKSVNRWRWNVCLTLAALVIGMGWAFSPKGFAWAGDIDKKIEQVVEEKLSPVVKEQKEQRALLDNVSRLLTDQLSATVAAQIRLNISKRCKTTDFLAREELAREKDRLQGQYRSYAGEYYREPSCSDL
jgi:hypothetical protein